jgi:lysophospholipase L1-like esterase
MAGIAASVLPTPGNKSISPEPDRDSERDLIFLFQGDSITDGNRGRNNDPNHIMGHGYAFSIASRVGAAFPQKNLSFYNRGISGNKITDLASRWQNDTLDIKPNLLSILIGVNDTDSVVRQKDIVTAEKFEREYRLLLNETKTKLPECLLVLCEPFILAVGRVKDNWSLWNTEIQKRQRVVANLSNEYGVVFVPFQNVFNKAATRANPQYWIWDGIHPTVAGHELMAREWLHQVGRKLHFLRKVD